MPLRHLLLPEAFQGTGAKPPYFEGWYYCLRKDGDAIAILPGICLGTDSHAFIQALDAAAGVSLYERYPLSAFRYAHGRFQVRVGNSVFSEESVHLDTPRLRGHILLHPRTAFSAPGPHTGEMGPAAFLPGLQCRHGVVNTSCGLHGHVCVDNRETTLDGGTGYVEKDWGRAFPRAYLWTQAHFGPVSFMLSLAGVPVPGGTLTGAIAFLYGPGLRLRFATYSGFLLKALCLPEDGGVHLAFSSPGRRLTLRLVTHGGLPLRAPDERGMNREIKEDLFASLRLRLADTRGNTLFYGETNQTGAELVGDWPQIRTQ